MNTDTLGELHLASIPLQRYPRTRHLEGSRLQDGDSRDLQRIGELAHTHAVIEEKLDGANSGLSFTQGAQLLLQSRGHYLMGGSRERQFAPMHQWAAAHEQWLLERLEDRYVMYGEWMYSKHSVFYDQLPGYFHEFDVWDRQEQCFLSTPRRRALLAGGPVVHAPVLYEGEMPQEGRLLTSIVRPSLGKSPNWQENFERAVHKHGLPLALCWQQTDHDNACEGLYVKVEDSDRVMGRFKFVRQSFAQTILDSGSHHAARPVIPNGLAPGFDPFAPQPSVTWADQGLVTIRGLDALRAAASRLELRGQQPATAPKKLRAGDQS
jgi:hypothetical protein